MDLRKAVADWCAMIFNKGIPEDKKDKLKVHIFECHYEDFETDVEISEVKKKEEKEDPRLAMRARRA